MLALYLFGPPRLELDGESIHIARRKALALFAYLAVSRQSHSREALAALLWPENDQSSARAELRRTLSVLRGKLGGEWLAADRETVGLKTENNPSRNVSFWLDVADFQGKLKICESHNHPATMTCPECLPELEAAVALYADDFMAGFSLKDCRGFDEWQYFQAEELRSQFANALQRLSAYYGEVSEYESALSHARRWLTLDQLHEPAQRNLMILYAQSGQQSAALRQYQISHQLLNEELGVEPSEETQALADSIRRGEGIQIAISQAGHKLEEQKSAVRTNLPVQLTSFIGREVEIIAICKLLSSNRLVTLTGVGGTGKTRLALRVADEVLDIFPDGTWFVELAHLTDPAMIPKTVASTLGLVEIPDKPIADSLVDYLENKHLLLVLDNCEHLLEACANLVYQILQSCPEITVLTTSREIMDVTGEIPFQVPPLLMPEDDAVFSVESLYGWDAVRLFVERARVVQPGFELSNENVRIVDEVVRRLDGIPLAIELAAARMRLLGVEQVAHRLSYAFRLLTGGARTVLPRHQTLRASIEWSYDLLSESERLLLIRLSVFAGSWSLDAAEMVCADEPGVTQSIRPDDVLDLLSDLVDKSLISTVSRDEGNNRFRMLETIRQYAAEKLARENLSNENSAEALRDRHLDYYQALSENAESQLRSAGRLECSQRLKIELENLRSAIDWAYKSPRRAQAGLRIVTAIGFRFLVPNGYFMDTLTWVMEGLDLTDNLPDQPLLRARAYNLLGEIYENQRNYKEVLIWVEKSLLILREMGSPVYPDLCWALWDYGIAVATMHEDYKHAFEAFDESIDISRQMGSIGTWYLGMSLFCRTIFVQHTDELFYRFNQESRQAFKQSGDRWSVMNPVDNLGEYAEMKNDFPEALRCYEEASRLSEEIGDQTNLSYMYLHLGRAYRKIGSFDQAIQYHADYIRLWTTMGNREAMKEGFVNLGLDWFSLGRSFEETNRRVYYQRAVMLIATAEKHRSIPYTFLYDPDLFDQMLNTIRSEWGEADFQKVWEEGQAMTLKEAVAFALDARIIDRFQNE